MEFCECGTGAIGRCANDKRPVCGDHSQLRSDRRLCMDCLREFDQRAAEDARQLKYQSALPTIQQFQEKCRMLRNVADPFTRFAVLSALQTPYMLRNQHVPADPELGNWLDSERRRVLTEESPNSFTKNELAEIIRGKGPLSDSQLNVSKWVEHWQQNSSIKRPTYVVQLVTLEKGIFGGSKFRKVGQTWGWQLEAGSMGTSGTYGTPGSPAKWLLSDGTLGTTPIKSHRMIDDERRELETGDILSFLKLGYLILPPLPKGLADFMNNEFLPLPRRQ